MMPTFSDQTCPLHGIPFELGDSREPGEEPHCPLCRALEIDGQPVPSRQLEPVTRPIGFSGNARDQIAEGITKK